MDWQQAMIERHKADIEQMRTSIEWMESGKLDVGEVDRSGGMISTKDEAIATYRRIIEQLEGIIQRAEGGSA